MKAAKPNRRRIPVQNPIDVKERPPSEIDASPDHADHAVQRYGGIGAELAATRERSGMSIPDLAQKMRIRAEYVEAIEQGEFIKLPGRIYAVGFIKTYARAMGIDAQTAVEAYKNETASTGTPERLEFPVPTPASRTPGVKLIVGALAGAFAIFGVWQLYSNHSLPKLDRVPPVPAYLLKPSEPLTAPSTASAGAAPLAQTAESTAPPPAAAPLPVHPDRTAAADVSPPALAAEPPAAIEVPRPLAKPAVPAWAQKRAEAPAPAPIMPESEPVDTAAADTDDAPEPPAPIQNAPGIAIAPPARATWTASDAGNVPSGGTVHGANNFDARIVINAANDAWVEVSNKNKDLVFAKLLRAGESYRVPDEEGLWLSTGNAGALRLTVDGVPVPALGTMGAVRRNVALEPDKLRVAPVAPVAPAAPPAPAAPAQ
jgi:cytoskeleton protein RodZ